MNKSRLRITIMLICITLTYFCSELIPYALMIQIVVFSVSGLFASLMCVFGKELKYRSVFFLCIWMLVKQIFCQIVYTSPLILVYRTLSAVAGFVFSYRLAVDVEAGNDNRLSRICLGDLRFKYLNYTDVILCIMIIWGILFLSKLDYERSKLNWGFANYSYFLLMLFPILPLSKNRWLKRGSVLIIIISVLMSKKRTGIIALLMCSVTAVLLALRDRRLTRSQALITVIFSVILFCAFTYTNIADRLFENFFYRFESGDVENLNGRIDIWIYGITKWINGGPIVWLFGGNIQYITGNGELVTMHNDFIEILVNYGFAGIILLIYVFVDIIKNILSAKKLILNAVFHSLTYAFVIMIIMMSTSHIIIYPYMLFMLLLTVGYCYGVIDSKMKEI